MRTYSIERKEAILSKRLTPLSRSIGDVAREEDIPNNTLYTWFKSELSAYCRKNGFYPEQVKAWKEEFVQGVENKSRTISTKESQADNLCSKQAE